MQCCEKMRDALGEENVLIGEPVTEIDQSDEDIVRVTTATGKEFKCRYIINAAPLHCSGEFLYSTERIYFYRRMYLIVHHFGLLFIEQQLACHFLLPH